MKLVEETKTLKYKEMAFSDLAYGDVFEDDDGDVCVKTRKLSYTGLIYNATHLKNGCFRYYQDTAVVYPLEATLHYERIMEG